MQSTVQDDVSINQSINQSINELEICRVELSLRNDKNGENDHM